MVLADSHGISRAPCYLGSLPPLRDISITGLAPTLVRLSRRFVYTLLKRRPLGRMIRKVPQPRSCNPCRVSHRSGLASSAFARHYSRNHMLFSLPVGTEMFHFPTFPLPALYIQAGVTRSARRPAGFPHSDILGSKFAYQLPEAYRRLLRPSSAPDAKAFTVCS